MKRGYLCGLSLLFGLAVFSQSVTKEIVYNKTAQPGLILNLPYSTDMAEGTILQKLKETGYDPEKKGMLLWRKNKIDGFYVFKGVVLPDMNNVQLDLYFKVDRQGKKEAEQSDISLLVSKGYDNFVSATTDTATFHAAKIFLDNFVAGTGEFKLNKDIVAQQDLIKQAENKLAKIVDDGKDIEKKQAQLVEDAAKNHSAQEQQTIEIEKQRKILEEMKSRSGAEKK